MFGMMPTDENDKIVWFQELMEIIKRSEKCLDDPERLEEFDLVSVCREFTDKLEEVKIYEGKHNFWDSLLLLNESAKDAVISYYMNAEEESAKRVCQNLVSARDIIEEEGQTE